MLFSCQNEHEKIHSSAFAPPPPPPQKKNKININVKIEAVLDKISRKK